MKRRTRLTYDLCWSLLPEGLRRRVSMAEGRDQRVAAEDAIYAWCEKRKPTLMTPGQPPATAPQP